MALFQRRRSYQNAKTSHDAPLGLVVPAREIIIMTEGVKQADGTWSKDEVIFDGVAERERQFRKAGRPIIEFDDTDEGDRPDIR